MKQTYISHKLKKLPKRAFIIKEEDLINIRNTNIILQSFQDDHYEIFYFRNLEDKKEWLQPWLDWERCWLCHKKNKDHEKNVDKADKLIDQINWGF